MKKDTRRALTETELKHAENLRAIAEFWQKTRKENKERWGLEAVADALDISQSAFSQFKDGKVAPNLEMWIKICNFFDISLVDIGVDLAAEAAGLAGAAGFSEQENEHEHLDIDLVDLKLSAGTGHISYYTDKSKKLAFRRVFLLKFSKEPEKFIKAFPVSGDSMVDAHIIDGGIVLVNTHPQYQVPTNKSIVALWIDEKIFIKQLIQLDNGQWIARSKNQEKETINEYKDRLLNADNMGIIGKVFWSCFEL